MHTRHSAAPACPSSASASAHGRSAARGARSTTTSRWPRCTPRWTRRQLHRHRRRLWRRQERAADRQAQEGTAAATQIRIATKAGRRLPAQTAEGYTRENLNRLGRAQPAAISRLDDARPGPAALSAPGAVYDRPEVFGMLDELVAAGKIRHYGVSVESVAEAHEGDSLHAGRDRADHLQHVPPEASRAVLRRGRGQAGRHHRARAAGEWPARRGSSGRASSFARPTTIAHSTATGQAFDKGETFSGVPYEAALEAVER